MIRGENVSRTMNCSKENRVEDSSSVPDTAEDIEMTESKQTTETTPENVCIDVLIIIAIMEKVAGIKRPFLNLFRAREIEISWSK